MARRSWVDCTRAVDADDSTSTLAKFRVRNRLRMEHSESRKALAMPHGAYNHAVSRLRFDAFELDLTDGELRKGATPLRLQPQPLKVLTLLASRAGQLVSR